MFIILVGLGLAYLIMLVINNFRTSVQANPLEALNTPISIPEIDDNYGPYTARLPQATPEGLNIHSDTCNLVPDHSCMTTTYMVFPNIDGLRTYPLPNNGRAHVRPTAVEEPKSLKKPKADRLTRKIDS